MKASPELLKGQVSEFMLPSALYLILLTTHNSQSHLTLHLNSFCLRTQNSQSHACSPDRFCVALSSRTRHTPFLTSASTPSRSLNQTSGNGFAQATRCHRALRVPSVYARLALSHEANGCDLVLAQHRRTRYRPALARQPGRASCRHSWPTRGSTPRFSGAS